MNDTSKIMTAIGIFIILYTVVLINLRIVEPPEIDLISLFVIIGALSGAFVIMIASNMEDEDKIKILEGRIDYLEDKIYKDNEKSEKDN